MAQILAWVYQVRDAMAAGRPWPERPPTPEIPADMDPLHGAVADGGNTGVEP